MRILHLIDNFDARFERDQVKLVELLEKRGFDATVITSRYSSEERLAERSEFRSWEKRFLHPKILHMPSLRIRTPFSVNPAIAYLPSIRIWHNYDIVHAYTLGSYSSLLAIAAKKVRRVSMVLRSDLSSAAYYKTKSVSSYRMMLVLPLRSAEAVYVYSGLEKRYLVGLGVQENKIWTIPMSIDFDKFSKNPIEQKDKNITIGYFGRFCFVKGIHRMIPALHTILRREKKVRVMFTGILEDVKYANNTMSPLKKFRNFEYLRDLSRSPLSFYDICDVILVPSISETGAAIVLEAMASGKVVIASNIDPIKEYIQHERSGFLFNEQKEVRLYLERLLESPNLIREIGRKAREEAAKYDWNLMIHRYEDMYRSVLE